jgi:hypothetical protein
MKLRALLSVLLAGMVLMGLMAPASGAVSGGGGASIERLVLDQLARHGKTDFFVWMKEKASLASSASLATKAEKGRFVFDALRSTANRTQRDLRSDLMQQGLRFQAFYIANKILVRGGTEAQMRAIAARTDVARITANHRVHLQEPIIGAAPAGPAVPTTVEPNISFVKADQVWATGDTGQGITLAGNDTGLDWTHPALKNQYRGWNGTSADHNYNWWDATGTYPLAPGDGHGHGTHTSGTMVGDDGGVHQIGMAPGARLVHCKNLDDGGNGDDVTITECFQWDLAPWDLSGQNPDPSKAPDAINNSWGYFGGNQPQFEDEVNALQAAGIAVEVSAGNEGSSCRTLRSPGDYAQVITTGSINHAGGVLPGTLTGFSSRGPSVIDPGEFFPDVMAPGENINSSLPGGGYSGPTWSGTSMSGPHVTGLIALMWSASPALRGNIAETFDAIRTTAIPLTGEHGSNCGGDYTTGPNQDWGMGTIDALAAVNEAIARGGPNFTLTAAPDTRSICTPANAAFGVTLDQIEGYSDPVALSVEGVPAGAQSRFNPNPATPPGSSNLIIGNTGAAAPGTYPLTISGVGSDPEAKTDSDQVTLVLSNAVPGAVNLQTPGDGAKNVALQPTLTWSAATQAAQYKVQVATDAGFTDIVFSATATGTSQAVSTLLTSDTQYFWRVRGANGCGLGPWATAFSFTTVPQLTWQFAKASPFAGTRFDGQFVSAQNRVYFLGFRTVGDATDGSVWYFDRNTGQFVDTGVDMPVPVSNYGIAALQDQHGLGLYIFGGRNANAQIVKTVQVYRPGTNTANVIQTDPWPGQTPAGCISLPAMGVAVVNNHAVVLGGMSFASNGCVDDQSAQTWVYDPSAAAGSRWSQGPDLNAARGYITPAVLGGRVYAIGGDTISGGSLFAVSTVEAWRPGTAAWNDAGVADLPQPCDESQAFGLSKGKLAGTVVLAGCGQWSVATPDVFLYDAQGNGWSNVGTLNETRRNHAGALLATGGSQTMLILGGYNEASGYVDPTPTSEASNPDALTGRGMPGRGGDGSAAPGVTTN